MDGALSERQRDRPGGVAMNRVRDNVRTLSEARRLQAEDPQRYASIGAAFSEARRREDGEWGVVEHDARRRMAERGLDHRSALSEIAQGASEPPSREALAAQARKRSERTGERFAEALKAVGREYGDAERSREAARFGERSQAAMDRHSEIAHLAEAALARQTPPPDETPSERYQRVKRAVLDAARVHSR